MTDLEKNTAKLTKLLKTMRQLDAIEYYKAIVAKQVREQHDIYREAIGKEK